MQGASAQTFRVEGEIGIAFAAAIDGDVNDAAAPHTPNDTLDTAQPLPNPVTLGGYANVAGAGTPGRSYESGDPVDVYRVALAEGQTVRLFVASGDPRNDLDLALIDADGAEIAFSDEGGAAESLTAPAAGEYRIRVTAFSGASNYVLVVAHAPANAAPSAVAESVPGEIVVRFRDASPGGRARARGRMGALGLSEVGWTPGGTALLACPDAGRMEQALRATGVAHLSERRERDATTRVALARSSRLLAKALRRRSDVASAEPNYLRRPHAVPSDEFYPLQWPLAMIELPGAWDQIDPEAGALVAVLDTGVAHAHPDLQGQLEPGFDFVSDPTSARDGDGCDADPEDPGDGAVAGEGSYHGTHVAGIVAARSSLTAGGDEIGVVGAAWSARVMPLRVLGAAGASDFDLIQAVRYAAGLENACDALPEQPARVLNLSLGGPSPSQALDAAIAAARTAGLVVVASAGNQGSTAASYPAASPGVISVSAVDAAEALTAYSSFGATIDVAAPGGDLTADQTGDGYPDGVLSTLFDDLTNEFVYGFYQGTSMAAPHVSAVLALMLGANPDLSPADIDSLLASGALTRQIGSRLLYGNGLIDAQAAVSAAIEFDGGTPPAIVPRPEVTPGLLSFGGQLSQANVAIANAGGDDPALVVSPPSAVADDGGDWLSAQPTRVDANGLGSYRVDVDRSRLGDGIHTGSLDFTSNAGNVSVPVIVQVGAERTTSADAGLHFVLLVDATDFSTAQSVRVSATSGRYRYAFADVEAGDYRIYAGTDSDNDRIVCDAGEACGSYPTLEEPLAIRVERNELGVDFLTGFALRLTGSTSAPTGAQTNSSTSGITTTLNRVPSTIDEATSEGSVP